MIRRAGAAGDSAKGNSRKTLGTQAKTTNGAAGKDSGKSKRTRKREEDNQSQYSSQTAKEQNWVPISVISQGFSMPAEQSRESAKSFEGGNQALGFGWYPSVTYNESRKWICEGRATINGLVSDCGDMIQEPLLNFMAWIHRVKQSH